MDRAVTEHDPDTLREMNRLLIAEIERLQQKVQEQARRIATLEGGESSEQLSLELATLQEQMATLQAKMFGDSSEKQVKAREPSPKKPQRGHGRTPQPNLPIVETKIEIQAAERVCTHCGETMNPAPSLAETSELIDVIRQQFVLRKLARQTYTCTCGVAPKTAPPPAKHIAKGRYSLDFAAYATTDKYGYHMPLARQVREMKRLGLNVTSQTLWDQVQAVARLLEPVYHCLQDYVLGSDVVGIDETWWRLVDKTPGKRWWVWSLATPDAVWYTIDASRSAKTAQSIVKDFAGTLICDGYKAYETVARGSPDIRLALCWAHVRRKFVDALPHAPQCQHAVDLLGNLFGLDRDTPDPTSLEGDAKIIAAKDRLAHRQQHAPGILTELKVWALAQHGLPKSSLRKAIDYMLNHWQPLQTFLDDPFVPLHNNDTERALRGPVVGRKNHYGSRSRRGTEVAAICYSLLETAVRNDLEPHAYLIAAAYGIHNGDDPARLLPLAHLW